MFLPALSFEAAAAFHDRVTVNESNGLRGGVIEDNLIALDAGNATHAVFIAAGSVRGFHACAQNREAAGVQPEP